MIGQRNTGGLVRIAVTTGGTGYTSPPTVTVSGGTGVTAYAQIDSQRVAGVVVAAAGTGFTGSPTVTFSGGGGTGAAAAAYANTGTRYPACFFKGRYGDVYAVDGMGRGLRWDGASTAAEPIGLAVPLVGPAVTTSGTTVSGFVKDIQILNAGSGYSEPPAVVFSGGTPATAAQAVAEIRSGRVSNIRVTEPGAGYQATPAITFTGGQGSPPTLNVGVLGEVRGLRVTATGSGYTTAAASAPTIVFSTAQGLTEAVATCFVNAAGQIDSVSVVAAGTGATTSGVTATVVGGGGTGAQVSVDLSYRVAAVTVASSGSGYYAPPAVVFRPAVSDSTGSGAAATAAVNTAGNVTGVTVTAGGVYNSPPTAAVENDAAQAVATISQPAAGEYHCCMRYIDDTEAAVGGPVASSISELVKVDAGTGAAGFLWTLSHPHLDDRVSAVELWRTTADQKVLLFRVATIQRDDAAFTSTYTDSFNDDDLSDPERDGYGLMPVTLPSGQINARRFQVPPGEFAVGVMFQDRAWYAVDNTGVRPNSLMYSEIDEPESVPDANELIVQENTGDPDKIVALIPLGSELLIAQQSHLYKLSYVAQPVLDASVVLGGYRGILNWRCWDTMGGVAFIADSYGLYAYDGNNEEPISVPIDNLWRDGVVDLSKSEKFHVACDTSTRTVRLFYCRSTDSEPVRALCYCVATKAWWEETYPLAVTANCLSSLGSRQTTVYGCGDGLFRQFTGTNDAGQAIAYDLRTGNYPLTTKDGNRSVAVLYRPTGGDADLRLRMHYNDSDSPRPNAIASNPGNGFATTAGGTEAVLNMKATRSELGEANGLARAYYSGRNDERSSGADRHIAVALAGTQASTNEVRLHSVLIEGAG
jgi:hypothetical protein